MSKSQHVLRHPLAHPAEAIWAIALCAAGQVLLPWALGKAAELAEREDLKPVV